MQDYFNKIALLVQNGKNNKPRTGETAICHLLFFGEKNKIKT